MNDRLISMKSARTIVTQSDNMNARTKLIKELANSTLTNQIHKKAEALPSEKKFTETAQISPPVVQVQIR